MNVLRLRRIWCKELAQRSAILCCWFLPVFLDRVPALAESLVVGIAVLRNDGGDPLWMR